MIILTALVAMLVFAVIAHAQSPQAVLHSQSLRRVAGVSWVAGDPSEDSGRYLSDYVIEPPDILLIDAVKLVPKAPYHLQPGDEIRVWWSGTPVDKPTMRRHRVDLDGLIDLGAEYGQIAVAGQTIDEVEDAIESHYRDRSDARVESFTLGRIAGQQLVLGEHLVGPDGTINLGAYGSIYVAGLTAAEAKIVVEDELKNYFDSPRVSVDYYCASKGDFYHVIVRANGAADTVTRVAHAGNETILDALAQVNGVCRMSSKCIWIARPVGGRSEQILPVDWAAITSGTVAKANTRILPGDRVFVVDNRLKELGETVHRFVYPQERIIGIGSLLGGQRVQKRSRFSLLGGK
jgi:polysaccharide export outer membrane protein